MQPRPAPLAFLVAASAIACYAGMDTVMKGLVRRVGAYDAMLWRCVAGAVLGGTLYVAGRPRWPTRAVLRMHVERGALIAVMAFLFFWGLARVPMAQAVALTFIAPLIALLLAGLVLRERIGARAVLASLIALCGVGTIFAGQIRAAPSPQTALGSVSIVASALCYAVNIVLMRRQALVSRPIEIAAFQNLVAALLLALAAPLLGSWPPVSALPTVGLAATLGVISAALLGWAYARAEASYLAASEYTAFIWAALFGFLFYGETVSGFTLAGAVLIVVGCVIAVRGRRPAAPPIEEGL